MSEWPKEQRWKRCVRFVRTAGSNPALSASLFYGLYLIALKRISVQAILSVGICERFRGVLKFIRATTSCERGDYGILIVLREEDVFR